MPILFLLREETALYLGEAILRYIVASLIELYFLTQLPAHLWEERKNGWSQYVLCDKSITKVLKSVRILKDLTTPNMATWQVESSNSHWGATRPGTTCRFWVIGLCGWRGPEVKVAAKASFTKRPYHLYELRRSGIDACVAAPTVEWNIVQTHVGTLFSTLRQKLKCL